MILFCIRIRSICMKQFMNHLVRDIDSCDIIRECSVPCISSSERNIAYLHHAPVFALFGGWALCYNHVLIIFSAGAFRSRSVRMVNAEDDLMQLSMQKGIPRACEIVSERAVYTCSPHRFGFQLAEDCQKTLRPDFNSVHTLKPIFDSVFNSTILACRCIPSIAFLSLTLV